MNFEGLWPHQISGLKELHKPIYKKGTVKILEDNEYGMELKMNPKYKETENDNADG